MRRAIIPLLILLLFASGTYAAHAFGQGEGNRFGKLGSFGKGKSTPQPNGDVLMVDGASLILQTDGASFICRAGGC